MGEFQFTDLLDNFLSLPLLIVLNQIVSKGPAIVRRAKEASLAVKGARLFNLLPGTIRNINYTLRHYAPKHNALMNKMPRWKIWPGRPYTQGDSIPQILNAPDDTLPREPMPKTLYPRQYAPRQICPGSNRVKLGKTG